MNLRKHILELLSLKAALRHFRFPALEYENWIPFNVSYPNLPSITSDKRKVSPAFHYVAKRIFILKATMVILCFTMCSFDFMAQIKAPQIVDHYADGNSIVLNVGASHYWGDLRDATFRDAIPFQDKSMLGVGLTANKRLFYFVDIGLKGLYTQLQAAKVKNLPGTLDLYSFDTKLWQVGANVSIDFIRIFNDQRVKSFGLFGLANYGLNGYNSQSIVTFSDGTNAAFENPSVTVSAGKNVEPVWSYGIGFIYRLNHHWSIGVESSLYQLSIDNLDGWSDRFSKNDQYSFTSLQLRHTFDRRNKKIKNNRDRRERRKMKFRK